MLHKKLSATAISCFIVASTLAGIPVMAEPTNTVNIEEKQQLLFGLTAAGTEDGIERNRTGWKKTDEGKVYILSDGEKATGVQKILDKYYAFDNDGQPLSGWINIDGEDRYCLNGGVLAYGVTEIGEDLYMFNEQGIPVFGWAKEDDALYYSDKSGKIGTGWIYCNGRTYFALDDGTVNEGWLITSDGTHYQTESGVVSGLQIIDKEPRIFTDTGNLASGIVEIGNYKYIADEDGYPLDGWRKDGEYTIYAEEDGRLVTGWRLIDDKRYYFDEEGHACTGTKRINEKEYTFGSDGELLIGFYQDEKNPANKISLSYNGNLYEGEIPDKSKITATINKPLTASVEEIGYIPNGNEWNETAYGKVELNVRTEAGESNIEVDAIPVDHVEAIYEGLISEDAQMVEQNVHAEVVYEDGTRKDIKDYSCEKSDSGEEIKIITDFGNATLVF